MDEKQVDELASILESPFMKGMLWDYMEEGEYKDHWRTLARAAIEWFNLPSCYTCGNKKGRYKIGKTLRCQSCYDAARGVS